jgi:plasmid segregation actin-type ATPase ParM
VVLSVGLPASRYGDEKNEFIKYLKQNDEVYFKFEQTKYHIWIDRILVYPQCYAAVVDRIAMFGPKVGCCRYWKLDYRYNSGSE